MTAPTEKKLLYGSISILLSVLSFIGALGINSNIKLVNAVNEMKTIISTHVATDKLEKDALRYEIQLLKEQINYNQKHKR